MGAQSLQSAFLDEMAKRLLRSMERARAVAEDLTVERLNWKPGPDQWSVAQCLEHIDAAAEHYLERLASAVELARQRGTRLDNGAAPRHTLVGRFVLMLVEPSAKRTMKTPKLFAPSQSDIPPEVVDRFIERHETLLNNIRNCEGLDVNRVKHGTPEVTFIRINAADAIKILVTHAERHLTQAERVRAAMP